MIFKKPYGLMIKHFKLIHLILLLLASYVLFQLRVLVGFFNDFVANGYTATILNNMASNYINVLIYLALIIMIGLLLGLIILLEHKKKPTKIYFIAVIYYAILFVGILIAAGLLNSLEEALWSTTAARMYRDIATLVTLPQYLFIPFWLIRALGFNVKQFNFQSDLAELNLLEADSEEVELNIGFETYKAKRKVRRFFREFKYYFYENKFIMFSILGVSIILMIYLFFSNFHVYTQKYKLNQSFNYANFNVAINDSIITNLTYSGNVTSKNSYYLLLKLTVTNNSNQDKALEYNQFIIYTKSNYYVPNLGSSSEFIDYGEGYMGDKITAGATKTIVLPYKISEQDIHEDFYVNIYNGVAKKSKDNRFNSMRIDLSSILINDIVIVKNVNMNTPISFEDSYLNNTVLNITNAEINSRYIYDYEVCNSTKCNTFKNIITPTNNSKKQTLLILDYTLDIDKSTPYGQSNSKIGSFAGNFFKIRYTINGETLTENIKNLTPDNIKNKFVVETNADIANASRVDLIVTVRNKSYVINLINK